HALARCLLGNDGQSRAGRTRYREVGGPDRSDRIARGQQSVFAALRCACFATLWSRFENESALAELVAGGAEGVALAAESRALLRSENESRHQSRRELSRRCGAHREYRLRARHLERSRVSRQAARQ